MNREEMSPTVQSHYTISSSYILLSPLLAGKDKSVHPVSSYKNHRVNPTQRPEPSRHGREGELCEGKGIFVWEMVVSAH